jgi:very-long-chain enoyl-CoA reductase
MKITVVSGKTTQRKEVLDVAPTATVADLKRAFKPAVSVHRKAFKTIGADAASSVALGDDRKALSDYGIKEGSEVQYKDLGPQVGYRTVFVVEYAGPIAFMAFYALRPSFIYGAAAANPMGWVQKLYVALFILHFVKRELETFFVHKFSRPTMPLMNIFKNSAYYWSFAAFIGYFLCHPLYTPPTHGLETIAAGAWGLMELGNLAVHLSLSGMRKEDGDTDRKPPGGPLFSLVSCPNYSFEVMGWVFYSLGTNIAMSWAFTLVGLLQMTDWALKKHRGYCKIDASYKKKKSILPFII